MWLMTCLQYNTLMCLCGCGCACSTIHEHFIVIHDDECEHNITLPLSGYY